MYNYHLLLRFIEVLDLEHKLGHSLRASVQIICDLMAKQYNASVIIVTSLFLRFISQSTIVTSEFLRLGSLSRWRIESYIHFVKPHSISLNVNSTVFEASLSPSGTQCLSDAFPRDHGFLDQFFLTRFLLPHASVVASALRLIHQKLFKTKTYIAISVNTPLLYTMAVPVPTEAY